MMGELDEERLGGLEILDADEHVVHPAKRHRSPVSWAAPVGPFTRRAGA
jgi:hypothetical protein